MSTDFISLACPTCGAKLEVTKDLDRFACSYCGHEHVVRRAGGIVSLQAVTEGLRQVQVGVDKTAAELALRRLKEELAELQADMETAQGEGQQRINRHRRLIEASRPGRWVFGVGLISAMLLFSVTSPNRNGVAVVAGLLGMAGCVLYAMSLKRTREALERQLAVIRTSVEEESSIFEGRVSKLQQDIQKNRALVQ